MFKQTVMINVEGLTEEEANEKIKKVQRINKIKSYVNTIIPFMVPLAFGLTLKHYAKKSRQNANEMIEIDGVEFTTGEERDEEDSEL